MIRRFGEQRQHDTYRDTCRDRKLLDYDLGHLERLVTQVTHAIKRRDTSFAASGALMCPTRLRTERALLQRAALTKTEFALYHDGTAGPNGPTLGPTLGDAVRKSIRL